MIISVLDGTFQGLSDLASRVIVIGGSTKVKTFQQIFLRDCLMKAKQIPTPT